MFSSWRDAVSAPSLVDVEAPRCGQTDPRAAARTISGIGARLRSGRGSVVLMTKPESLPRRHEFAAGWVCPPLSAGERSGDLLVRERKAVDVGRCLAAPTCPARTLARGVKKSAALTARRVAPWPAVSCSDGSGYWTWMKSASPSGSTCWSSGA